MFGRVSTVDLGLYANIPDATNFVYGMGVVAGKKWTGNLAPANNTNDYRVAQVEPNWIELQDGDVYYPEYSFDGSNLPDFVSLYREENGRPSNKSNRVLVGEGTSAIGPFTLQEAVYFYSVAKKLKPESDFIAAFSATAGGSTASLSSLTETEYIQNYAGTDTYFSDPYYLFRVSRKNYISVDGYNNAGNSTSNTSEGAVVSTNTYAREYVRPYGGNMQNTAFIAVDIDNPNEYYIDGLGFDLFVLCEANSYATSEEGGYASASTFKEYILKPLRFRYVAYSYSEETGQDELALELTQVGQTAEYGGATLTYVSIPHTYTIGEITKTHNFYGVVRVGSTSDSGGDNPPQPPAVSVVAPNPEFVVDVSEFWPYKNASGQPVYNTETGAIVNSPLS